jgi:putative ABC transport system permease protein
MLWETFKLATLSVRRNALRSVLTLLGIVIGVAAVIAMVTIGNGATEKIKADLSKLGSNMLVVRPGRETFGPGGASTESRSFNERDVAALREALRNVRGVAPSASRQVRAVVGADSADATVTGTDTSFFNVQDWVIAEGRALSDGDVRSASPVCVIGQTIRRTLFAGQSPVGARLRLNDVSCEVIGTVEAKGQSAFGTDQDNVVFMPLRAFQRRIAGNTRINNIYISAATAGDVASVQAAAEDLLRERRRVLPGESDDFTVRDLSQIASTMSSTTAVMTGLLSAVAGVSLLVGGIGIMNIMLVSVTERTREIGIRLAIGALGQQVLTQFLVEAVVLAAFGGLIGIMAGLGLAYGASVGMSIPFTTSLPVILLAFLFSAFIGVLFGYFPARRAARLDPIEALRHE